MAETERTQFLHTWERETAKTVAMLRALPSDQYDFRPDPSGRSLGELAWHLAEGEGIISETVASGAFDSKASASTPGLKRPTAVDDLLPAFERVHADAVTRVTGLSTTQLMASIRLVSDVPVPVSVLLWEWMLMANIHHRGQLSLLCRLAGGVAPGTYGPNREEMAALNTRA